MKFKNLIFGFLLLGSLQVHAWGKRGHQIVAETAALLVSDEDGGRFLRDRSYDLGYYSNVPDLVWKRPETYELEKHQHFMDWEHFEKAFAAKPSIKKPLELDREKFNETFPELRNESGRAFWRIRELVATLEDATASLRKLKSKKGDEKRELQKKWLVTAGVLSHYIGDLSQPLHVTENYDGQLTGQKGLHSYFEDALVDEIYPVIATKVYEQAISQKAKFHVENKTKTLVELLQALVKSSAGDIPELLKTGRSAPRAHTRRDRRSLDAKPFEKLIEKRLVTGSLYLAEIYRRNLGWEFDGEKFYFFDGEPEFVKVGSK